MSRTIKRIWNVFTSIIVVLAVLIAVFLVGVRLIAGLTPFSVQTGSMEPEYPVGSLVYVKECTLRDIKPGDTVSFVINADLDVATHKVESVDLEKGTFVTYGIANKDDNGNYIMDGERDGRNLIGKVAFSIPYLGYVSDYVMNPPGSYIAVIILLTLLILAFIPDIVEKTTKKEKDDKSDSAAEK